MTPLDVAPDDLADSLDDSDGDATESEAPARRRLVPCPACGLPLALREPQHFVDFPDDVAAIEQVVSGEFNGQRHWCGALVTVGAPVMLAWPNAGRAVLVRFPLDQLDVSTNGWDITEVDDHRDLQRIVIDWIAEEGRALWETMTDGGFDSLDRPARIAVVSPLRLLAWALEIEGRRRSAANPVEHDALGKLEEIYVGVVTSHLHDLALQAGHDDVPHELVDVIRRAVPRRCLTPRVLEELAHDRDSDFARPPVDPARVATAFRAEYTCAAAHAAAEVANPRRGAWAAMLVVLWTLSRRDDVQMDDRFFLTPAALQSTVSFEVLVEAASAIALPDEAVDLPTFGGFFGAYAELMERAGYLRQFVDWFQDRFARGVAEAQPSVTVPELFEVLTRNGGGESLGRGAASFAERWTQAFPDRTAEVVSGFAERLRGAGALEELCRFVAGSTVWLNRRHEWQVAHDLVAGLMERLEQEAVDLPPEDAVDLWNEIGNTFRYVDRPTDALAAYGVAAERAAGLPDEERRLRIISRNRAIVLRDYGYLSEAETELLRLVAAQPDDPQVLHSLAVFYDRVGEPEKGLELMDRILASPLLVPAEAALFLGHRADFRRELGRDDDAVADLRTAWRILPEAARDERMRQAAIAARCRPTDVDLAAFREDLVDFVLHRGPDLVDAPGRIGAGALSAVAEAALSAGDTSAARHALQLALPDPRSPETTTVGQLAIDWAWLRVAEGAPEDALPWFVRGLESLERSLPTGEDASFALTWLRRTDDVVDRLLELAPRITADPALLITVYEAANGRELSAGIVDHDDTRWHERLAEAAQQFGCDVVVVLDGAERLTLVVVPASGAATEVSSLDVPAEELQHAVRQLLAFDDANPVAPHRVDPKLADWWRVAGSIADAVRPMLGEGTEVVFLPGRRLASTPLHLAGWPAAPLVAERPVSACPNARVLLSGPAPVDGPMGVVVVPKAGDSERFRAALHAAAETFAASSEGTRLLLDDGADEEAVLALAAGTGELVFLCHGISSSGPGQGPGICVAADGLLPPSPLPVETDPELGRFALSWSDLLALRAAPRSVVSMACSSGRSQIGAGGTRLGLEQGLLTRGTAVIVSPLWNIDQQFSLTWLRAFYDAHRPGRVTDVSAAHRAACLTTAESHPHPFAWGPFILTRRLTEEPA